MLFRSGSQKIYTKDTANKEAAGMIVAIQDLEAKDTDGKSDKEIVETIFNPATEPKKDSNSNVKFNELPLKEVQINGQKGFERTISIIAPPLNFYFRETAFYSAANKKIYVVRLVAQTESDTTKPAAEAFINSFRLSGGWF